MKLKNLKNTVMPFQVTMFIVISLVMALIIATALTAFIALVSSATFTDVHDAPIMSIISVLIWVISMVVTGNWLWD